MKTVQITREQNKLVRNLIESHTKAIKNWTASAVETGKFEYATELTKRLREHEKMYHIFVPDEMYKE